MLIGCVAILSNGSLPIFFSKPCSPDTGIGKPTVSLPFNIGIKKGGQQVSFSN